MDGEVVADMRNLLWVGRLKSGDRVVIRFRGGSTKGIVLGERDGNKGLDVDGRMYWLHADGAVIATDGTRETSWRALPDEHRRRTGATNG